MKIEVGKTYEHNFDSNENVTVKDMATEDGMIIVIAKDDSGRQYRIIREQFLKEYSAEGESEPSKPAHYDTAIDTIAFAKANFTPEQVEGFMRINAVKYIQRYDKKNGVEDIRKAIVYLNMLLEHVEGEEK